MTAKTPIVDAHMHLWDLQHPDLHWSHLQDPDFVHPIIGPQLGRLAESNYEILDYLRDIEGWGVAKSMHVQAAMGSKDPADETKWLQGLADEHGFPQGIVGEADLRDPKVSELLERHCQYPNMRGIRDFSYGDYLVHPDFHRGFALLEEYGLIASLDVKWEDMEKLALLAEQHPGVVIVLDHAGFPTERTKEYLENWMGGISRIAECENIYCKVSGLGMGDNEWDTDRIRPWVDHCIDCFSDDRTIFASNWPVDSLWSDYGTIVQAYREILSVRPEVEQEKILGGNAARLYRL